MTEPDAFLAAILAAPDDDLPRLVFADWLDERGDEAAAARAALIRVQCEAERLAPTDDRRAELERQAGEMVRKHSKEWLVAARKARVGGPWEFRRGFPHRLTISATRFLHVAEEVFRLVPTARALRCPNAANELDTLAGSPHLAKITELDLSQMCACERCPILPELRRFFTSTHLSKLTRLNVSQNRINPETVAALAASKWLSQLVSLDLGGDAVATAGVRSLTGSNVLKYLVELNLRDNQITSAAGKVLAESPLFGRLRVLDLSRNRLGDRGGRALLASPYQMQFTRLDLRNNGISPAVKKALRDKFGAAVTV